MSLVFPFCPARAEDDAPPPKLPGVRIAFVPPPMEGTLSLGIYDKAGKLVRTLASEATENDFTVGLNGLIKVWDGRDDVGKVLPAGTYSVRGYSVGAIDVEGVGYQLNDWMTDDGSPRIRRVLPGGVFAGIAGVNVAVELANGNHARLQLLPNTAETPQLIDEKKPAPTDADGAERKAAAEALGLPSALSWWELGDEGIAWGDGKLWRRVAPKKWEPATFPDLHRVVAAAFGAEGIWIIDEADSGAEVKEYSRTGEILRRLPIEPGEPIPREIDAKGDDELFLLEENASSQRARILWREPQTAESDGASVSLWRTVASKTISFSDTFEAAKNSITRSDGKPFAPAKDFTVKLVNNPLLADEPTVAHVTVGIDARGSFIQTTDGLPLRRITETPSLKWAVIGREGSGKLLTILQSDGAVVEEFRARRLASMMAFDAGEYEWDGK